MRPNHAAGKKRFELAALGNTDIEQGDTIYRFCLIYVRYFIGMHSICGVHDKNYSIVIQVRDTMMEIKLG